MLVIPSQTFLKKSIYKRFLSLRNTPAHCIAFIVNPSPEHDRLSFISAEKHAVVVFYCPGPRTPRGGTSLEKLLPLIHPLDDHLAVHVAHINRVNAWAWLLEHLPIQKLPQGTRKLSSEIV